MRPSCLRRPVLAALISSLALVAAATPPAFTAAAPAAKKAPKPVLHGDPARALVTFQAMQKAYYIPGSGLYAGGTILLPVAVLPGTRGDRQHGQHPDSGGSFAPELHARLHGLKATSTPTTPVPPKGPSRAARRPSTGPSPRRQGPAARSTTTTTTGSGWSWCACTSGHARRAPARRRRRDHGVRDGRLAGTPEFACPGGIPFSNLPKTANATPSQRPRGRAGNAALPAHRQRRVPALRRKGLRMGAACLLHPSGLYADHIGRRGVVEPHLWSYNQGA